MLPFGVIDMPNSTKLTEFTMISPFSWSYFCEDVYALIQAKVTGTGFVSAWAQAFRQDTDEDLWIDQVMFHRQTPLADDQMGETCSLVECFFCSFVREVQRKFSTIHGTEHNGISLTNL